MMGTMMVVPRPVCLALPVMERRQTQGPGQTCCHVIPPSVVPSKPQPLASSTVAHAVVPLTAWSDVTLGGSPVGVTVVQCCPASLVTETVGWSPGGTPPTTHHVSAPATATDGSWTAFNTPVGVWCVTLDVDMVVRKVQVLPPSEEM